MGCSSCGNTGCKECVKSTIQLFKPSSWIGGQTGIPGGDGEPGNGIINIIDNMDGTFTIYLSDGSDYTITMPAASGKYVVDINPVAGGDNLWELVYNDASTLIIPAAYYLTDITVGGVSLIDNETNHPTFIKGIKAKNSNSKVLIEDTGNDATVNVKQYGRQDALIFEDNLGTNNYMQPFVPRYETAAGSTAPVTRSGGGAPVDNLFTEKFEIGLEYIDAYKAIMYYNILQRFDITYNDISYTNAVKKKFHMVCAFTLPDGTPELPPDIWDANNSLYFHMNHTTCMWDMYRDEQDNTTNKLRRYADHKVCDAYLAPAAAGATDPGWIGDTLVGDKLVFRYPYVESLDDPGAVGMDVTLTYRFEAIGSILVHLDSNTDFLSTINQIKNH